MCESIADCVKRESFVSVIFILVIMVRDSVAAPLANLVSYDDIYAAWRVLIPRA